MTPAGPACQQPGCAGRLDDGYCDTCGLAPASLAAIPPPSPGPGGLPTSSSPPAGASSPPYGGSLREVLSGGRLAAPAGLLAGGSSGAPGMLPGGWAGSAIRYGDAPMPSDFARAGATVPAPAPASVSRWRGQPPDVVRPLLPSQDPLASLVEGSVPAGRRFCSGCDAPLGPEQGQCPRCGQAFSFVPTLAAGEIVAGRYEVKGTLAFGGLGWIYLALDRVLGRWVVLKGVLNTHDPRLLAVAAQEREHLAALRHPQLVAIHDVLTHGREGFLVMEYVNGRSLAALRRQAGGPLPPADALAYLVEALPALEYLASMGLIHCDIKPDNLMVEEGAGVRLIDLGAVRRVDQEGGDVYGSRGYSAPEADERPSLRSDVYSVGRTLAVLVTSFDHQGAHEHSLPPPAECEVWRQHPALLALIERATAPLPDDRFASATELREQAAGVLRLLVGDHPALGPARSRHFSLDEPADAPDRITPPDLLADDLDEGAPAALAARQLPDLPRRRDALTAALRRHPRSVALRLGLLDLHLAQSEWGEFERRLAELDAPPWLRPWWQARRALREGRPADAAAAVRQVTAWLPGELAPRLVEASALEAAGDLAAAAPLLASLLRASPALSSAAFALARVRLRQGDPAGAADALALVPASSRHHEAARHEQIAALLACDEADPIVRAADLVASPPPGADPFETALLRAETLAAAARVAARGQVRSASVLGVSFAERELRLAASAAWKQAARLAREPGLRAQLLDEAVAVRPWTWLLAARLVRRLARWRPGSLAAWFVGGLVRWRLGSLAARLVGWDDARG